MTTSNLTNLVIGVAVLGFILVRQLQAQPAKANFRLPVILAVLGIIQLTSYVKQHEHHSVDVFAALAGSLFLAALFAGFRAATVHVWVDGGVTWRKGTWLTAVLWIASLVVHLGYDYLVDGRGGAEAGLGSATLLLYFAVTYTIQRFIVQARAQRIADSEHLDGDTHMTVQWP
jgi:hypothetical protein